MNEAIRKSDADSDGPLAGPVRAQNQKEMTQALQRDIAALQEDVKKMKASQDERLAVINENLRNALDVVARINEKMAVMQTNINDKLKDVSVQVAAPTQHLRQKVDAMNDQFLNLSNTIAELNSRLGKLDTKMDDVKKMIQTIPPAAQAPPANQASAPPLSGDKLFDNGEIATSRRATTDLAMKGFNNYLVNFTADSPIAHPTPRSTSVNCMRARMSS